MDRGPFPPLRARRVLPCRARADCRHPDRNRGPATVRSAAGHDLMRDCHCGIRRRQREGVRPSHDGALNQVPRRAETPGNLRPVRRLVRRPGRRRRVARPENRRLAGPGRDVRRRQCRRDVAPRLTSSAGRHPIGGSLRDPSRLARRSADHPTVSGVTGPFGLLRCDLHRHLHDHRPLRDPCARPVRPGAGSRNDRRARLPTAGPRPAVAVRLPCRTPLPYRRQKNRRGGRPLRKRSVRPPLREECPAASYSPTRCPTQYHRRRRA